MEMWKCPICGKMNTSGIRCDCGWNDSVNYERYPVVRELTEEETDRYIRLKSGFESGFEKPQPADDKEAVPPSSKPLWTPDPDPDLPPEPPKPPKPPRGTIWPVVVALLSFALLAVSSFSLKKNAEENARVKQQAEENARAEQQAMEEKAQLAKDWYLAYKKLKNHTKLKNGVEYLLSSNEDKYRLQNTLWLMADSVGGLHDDLLSYGSSDAIYYDLPGCGSVDLRTAMDSRSSEVNYRATIYGTEGAKSSQLIYPEAFPCRAGDIKEKVLNRLGITEKMTEAMAVGSPMELNYQGLRSVNVTKNMIREAATEGEPETEAGASEDTSSELTISFAGEDDTTITLCFAEYLLDSVQFEGIYTASRKEADLEAEAVSEAVSEAVWEEASSEEFNEYAVEKWYQAYKKLEAHTELLGEDLLTHTFAERRRLQEKIMRTFSGPDYNETDESYRYKVWNDRCGMLSVLDYDETHPDWIIGAYFYHEPTAYDFYPSGFPCYIGESLDTVCQELGISKEYMLSPGSTAVDRGGLQSVRISSWNEYDLIIDFRREDGTRIAFDFVDETLARLRFEDIQDYSYLDGILRSDAEAATEFSEE